MYTSTHANDSLCVSPTVTLKVAVPLLLALSVAVQVTKVWPTGNRDPLAGKQITTSVVPSTMSVALAVKVTTAPEGEVACAVMLLGTVTRGAVVSTTVTLKLAVAELPVVSVVVQFTTVRPRGKAAPLAGTQVTTSPLPSTMSVALAV